MTSLAHVHGHAGTPLDRLNKRFPAVWGPCPNKCLHAFLLCFRYLDSEGSKTLNNETGHDCATSAQASIRACCDQLHQMRSSLNHGQSTATGVGAPVAGDPLLTTSVLPTPDTSPPGSPRQVAQPGGAAAQDTTPVVVPSTGKGSPDQNGTVITGSPDTYEVQKYMSMLPKEETQNEETKLKVSRESFYRAGIMLTASVFNCIARRAVLICMRCL